MDQGKNMEEKVFSYIEQYRMIEAGDQVIVGVSGGADSVCLLKLLSKWKESWGISLKAVHVHHQLRGKEADEDEAFVRRLCEGEGIVCQVFHEDVQGIANREKTGLEEAGRLARYRCFTKVCEEAGGGKIALAHHQDDLAETMLHHLVRGTGIAGLCSLNPYPAIGSGHYSVWEKRRFWHIWKRQDSPGEQTAVIWKMIIPETGSGIMCWKN